MPDLEIKLEEECTYSTFHTTDDHRKVEYCYRGYLDDRRTKKCPHCNGTGYVPTAFGEDLLDFIKRHS